MGGVHGFEGTRTLHSWGDTGERGLPTDLGGLQDRNMVQPLCRDAVMDLMRRRGEEETFCFPHVLHAGMEVLELRAVHRPERGIPFHFVQITFRGDEGKHGENHLVKHPRRSRSK